MNKIEKCLQINLLVLVILSTLLLGNGLYSTTVPLVGLVGAIAAYLLTDRMGIIRLDKFIANIAAIIVSSYSIFRFFEVGTVGSAKLSAIADLLIYVQIVLLFQEKNKRLYWHIWILSLLQVVVAGALNVQFEIGILFIVFVVLAINAMGLMAMVVDKEEPRVHRSKRRYVSSSLRDKFAGMVGTPARAEFERSESQNGLWKVLSVGLTAGLISLFFGDHCAELILSVLWLFEY